MSAAAPSDLEKKWPVKFREPKLLRQALTHRSYLNEHPGLGWNHNERLEFLGDAVLELVITDYLYHEYPASDEGELTAYRAALVNAETLARAATEAGLGDCLLLSRGEEKSAGRAREAILANAFEAVVAALFLDQGYGAARNFIASHLFPKIESIVKNDLWQDAKSRFQEAAQENANITPSYQVLSEEGPDHDKIFTVGLYLGEELVAQGSGSSKQRAEQEAARLGLLAKKWTR